jgi:rhodanese-related sulfurtransferase
MLPASSNSDGPLRERNSRCSSSSTTATAWLRLRTIEGSINIPLSELSRRLSELSRDRQITAYCAGGYRSAIAVSLLQREGFERVSDLAGGYAAWSV